MSFHLKYQVTITNNQASRYTVAIKTTILILFVVSKILLQYLLVGPEYELHRDELLHLDQAHHLAWGFNSVPPVTSWISRLILFWGNSLFWIRFFPALFGALTIVVVWKASEALKGNLFALVLGASSILFSALLRLNLLYQPNSLDVLCWTTFCFMLIKYVDTEKPRWLYVGISILAIGFLNKYNVVFMSIGLFPALLITNRTIFTDKNFYFSIVLGLVLISPNLFWQYNNHFPVFHHFKQLTERQLVNVNRWDFLKDQWLFFIGSIFVIISALYALIFYAPFKKYKLFFWALCFTLLVFICLKGKSYYAIGLYPIYIAFGSVFIGNSLKTGWRRYLKPLAIAMPVLFFIPMYKVVFPNKSPDFIANNPGAYKELRLLRWEDGKDHSLPQDFGDMLGWKELACKIDSIYLKLPTPDQTLILCDNYGQAGAINYYTKIKGIKAVSFNADYINWFVLDKKFIHLIRVKTLGSEENELSETSPYFDIAYEAGSITNSFAREYGTTIFVFLQAKIDINERIRKEIDMVNNHR